VYVTSQYLKLSKTTFLYIILSLRKSNIHSCNTLTTMYFYSHSTFTTNEKRYDHHMTLENITPSHQANQKQGIHHAIYVLKSNTRGLDCPRNITPYSPTNKKRCKQPSDVLKWPFSITPYSPTNEKRCKQPSDVLKWPPTGHVIEDYKRAGGQPLKPTIPHSQTLSITWDFGTRVRTCYNQVSPQLVHYLTTSYNSQNQI